LRIIQRTHDRLERCCKGPMIFNLILSSKEFIIKRNNMITIVRRLGNEERKIGIAN